MAEVFNADGLPEVRPPPDRNEREVGRPGSLRAHSREEKKNR